MKSILMIGGGIQQVPAVARLKSVGYRVIVSDMNANAPAFAEADVCVNIGANDIKSLVSWVLLNQSNLNIAGIFTLTNYAVSVALVANATDLPSIPVDVAVTCDNKLLMKRKFHEHRFLSAPYSEVKTEVEAIEAFRKFNATCYLKIVDGFGGKGVAKIKSEDDITRVFNDLQKQSLYPELILEEEITGHYIDTQGVFYDGEFYPAGDADSYFTTNHKDYRNFNPVENYNVCPSHQPQSLITEAYDMLRDIAKSLKMDFGPVGGDFIVNEKGIYVIEVGPRLHGPNGTLQMFPKAMNIKPLEFMAQVLCNDIPDPEFVKISRESVALCKVFTSPLPEITEAGFSSDPLAHDGVFSSHVYKKADMTITQGSMKLSGLASVFVYGKDIIEAEERLASVSERFYVR